MQHAVPNTPSGTVHEQCRTQTVDCPMHMVNRLCSLPYARSTFHYSQSPVCTVHGPSAVHRHDIVHETIYDHCSSLVFVLFFRTFFFGLLYRHAYAHYMFFIFKNNVSSIHKINNEHGIVHMLDSRPLFLVLALFIHTCIVHMNLLGSHVQFICTTTIYLYE